MKNKWILIANTNQAALYATPHGHKKVELALVRTFNHPESRGFARDLTSDKPGHYVGGAGAHGAYEEPDHKEIEIGRFAAELAEFLEDGSKQQLFTEIDIYAEPHFLGILLNTMPEKLHTSIGKKVHHDYVALSEHELASVLNKSE